MTDSPLGARSRVKVTAQLLGERIAVPRPPPGFTLVGTAPALLRVPAGGCAVVFRYGALVCFDVAAADRLALQQALELRGALDEAERQHALEEATLELEPGHAARIAGGVLRVPDLRAERLQLIAVALAKSVVLDHHEHRIAAAFDAVEPLARELHKSRHPARQARALLSHIGAALLAEQQMTGRVEVREKPDLLWDQPDLERFYARLEDEYELRDRAAELERKLELISRTARAALELLQHRHSLRVEWYIVLLIVVEIGLTLYDFWWR